MTILGRMLRPFRRRRAAPPQPTADDTISTTGTATPAPVTARPASRRQFRRSADRSTPKFDASLAKSPGYDEIFEAPGVVRAHWTKVLPLIEGKTNRQMEQFKELSQAELKEDYCLNPVPRMMSAKETTRFRPSRPGLALE